MLSIFLGSMNPNFYFLFFNFFILNSLILTWTLIFRTVFSWQWLLNQKKPFKNTKIVLVLQILENPSCGKKKTEAITLENRGTKNTLALITLSVLGGDLVFVFCFWICSKMGPSSPFTTSRFGQMITNNHRFCLFLFVFGCVPCRILVLHLGIKPVPQHWNQGVLTTGPPGKSLEPLYWTSSGPWWLNGKESACNTVDTGSIPGLGISPEEGNGNPLQYFCLGNPMDRGAWWVPGFLWTQFTGLQKSQT